MNTTLWAVSDLHGAVKANVIRIEEIQPADPSDWLIVAGDVAERTDLVLRILRQLRGRFAKVIWVPGNHELFSRSTDRYQGRDKYTELVDGCREIDVLTPEDPYPVFDGLTIVPLFTLYDYSFRPPGLTAQQAVARASVKLDDEIAIAPYVDIEKWCAERIEYTEDRLKATRGEKVLVNHWPLVVEPTHRLRMRDIALWCGTTATRDWPVKHNAVMAIHGHLHIPVETRVDGISHVEVSLGYPFEQHPPHLARPWPFPVMQIS